VTPPPAAKRFIEGYGAGGFRILGAAHAGSALVAPHWHGAWPVTRFEDVTLESLAPLLAAGEGAQILLIGCGPRMQPVPAALRAQLRAAGLVAEAMDTGAACRTYNVLLGEERRVAAALIAIA